MALTDKQRADLHAGIYAYLLSRGSQYAPVVKALALADPDVSDVSNESSPSKSSTSAAPILEKKWTAVPRLQRRVLELERQLATNARIHAHRTGDAADTGSVPV